MEGLELNQDFFEVEFDEDGKVSETFSEEPKEEIVEEGTAPAEEVKEEVSFETPEEDIVEEGHVQEEIIEESDENVYSVFASTLKSKDFLPDVPDEDLANVESEDDLAEVMNKQIESVIANQLGSINEKSYGAVAHFLNGGSVDEFVKNFNTTDTSVLSYKEEDITEDENIQRKVLETYYKKTTKFSDKKIKKLVDNDIDLSDTDEVIANYKELKELDKQEKENFAKQTKDKEAQLVKQREESEKALYDSTVNYSEFIPGRKLDKKAKEKVFENIAPVMSKINKDLTKYAPILAYLDHYKLLDGDFSKIMKEAETKQTSKLANVIKNSSIKRNSDKTVSKKDDSDFKRILRESLRD